MKFSYLLLASLRRSTLSLKLDNACVSLPDVGGVKNHILGYWNGMFLCSPMFFVVPGLLILVTLRHVL